MKHAILKNSLGEISLGRVVSIPGLMIKRISYFSLVDFRYPGRKFFNIA
jgi:hypothetical protein